MKGIFDQVLEQGYNEGISIGRNEGISIGEARIEKKYAAEREEAARYIAKLEAQLAALRG